MEQGDGYRRWKGCGDTVDSRDQSLILRGFFSFFCPELASSPLWSFSLLSLISNEGTFQGNQRAGGADWPATKDPATSWLSVASLTVS